MRVFEVCLVACVLVAPVGSPTSLFEWAVVRPAGLTYDRKVPLGSTLGPLVSVRLTLSGGSDSDEVPKKLAPLKVHWYLVDVSEPLV